MLEGTNDIVWEENVIVMSSHDDADAVVDGRTMHCMYRVCTDDKIENWKSSRSRMSANELMPQSAVVDGEMS